MRSPYPYVRAVGLVVVLARRRSRARTGRHGAVARPPSRVALDDPAGGRSCGPGTSGSWDDTFGVGSGACATRSGDCDVVGGVPGRKHLPWWSGSLDVNAKAGKDNARRRVPCPRKLAARAR
ncbi:unnamed protein product [Urochloa humidicola]